MKRIICVIVVVIATVVAVAGAAEMPQRTSLAEKPVAMKDGKAVRVSFAATAPVSYPIDRDPLERCQPSRPIAVSHFHGFGDTLVPYAGGIFSVAVQDSFARWREADGCSDAPSITFDDGAGSFCETSLSCDGGVEAQLCSLQGEHELYTTNTAFDIADFAWMRQCTDFEVGMLAGNH